MIKTKSIKDPPEKSDGKRFLVMRFWPQGYSHKQLLLTKKIKELSPSVKLLNDWNDGKISWKEYKKRFLEEISAQQDIIKEMAKSAKRGTITLICKEPEDDPHCHRHLLKKLIERQMKKANS
jgi:uncharacterized protein YeaO (DUF488 family)